MAGGYGNDMDQDDAGRHQGLTLRPEALDKDQIGRADDLRSPAFDIDRRRDDNGRNVLGNARLVGLRNLPNLLFSDIWRDLDGNEFAFLNDRFREERADDVLPFLLRSLPMLNARRRFHRIGLYLVRRPIAFAEPGLVR